MFYISPKNKMCVLFFKSINFSLSRRMSIFINLDSFLSIQKNFKYGSFYYIPDLIREDFDIDINTKYDFNKITKIGIGLLQQHLVGFNELDKLSTKLIFGNTIGDELRIDLNKVVTAFKLYSYASLNSTNKVANNKDFINFELKFNKLNFLEKILFVLIILQYFVCLKTKLRFNINSVVLNLLKSQIRIFAMLAIRPDFFSTFFNEILLYTGTNPNNVRNFDFKIKFKFSNNIDLNTYINSCIIAFILISSLTEVSALPNDKDNKLRNYNFSKVSKYDLEQRLAERCKFTYCLLDYENEDYDISDVGDFDCNILYSNCIRIVAVMCFDVENPSDFLFIENVNTQDKVSSDKTTQEVDKYIITSIKIVATQTDFFNFTGVGGINFSSICDNIRNNKIIESYVKSGNTTHFITRLKVLRSKVKAGSSYDLIETIFYYRLNINIFNDIILGINLNISTSPYFRYKNLLITDNIFLTENIIKRGYFQKKNNKLDFSAPSILSKNRVYVNGKFLDEIFSKFYVPKLHYIELGIKPTMENSLQLIQDIKISKIQELKEEASFNIIKLLEYHAKQINNFTQNNPSTENCDLAELFFKNNADFISRNINNINIKKIELDQAENDDDYETQELKTIKNNKSKITESQNEFIKVYLKNKNKISDIYEISKLYNVFYSIPISSELCKNEVGFYTSHFLDFRGRMYPSTSASALNIKYIRPFFSSSTQVESNINYNFVYKKINFNDSFFIEKLNNSKYALNLKNLKISLGFYNKYIKTNFDDIYLIILFLELGKVNKTKIMVNSKVTLQSFVDEGIKIYECADFITDDSADYSHYLSIKDCIYNFLNTGLFNNITIFKDSTASTFQHWAHLLGTNQTYDFTLNLSGNEWCDPYSIMIENFINEKYPELVNDDYFLKITSRSILKKVLMTYGYSVTIWTSKKNYTEELKQKNLFSKKLEPFYDSIILNLFSYLNDGLFKTIFSLDKNDYLRVLFNDTNYATNIKVINQDLNYFLGLKESIENNKIKITENFKNLLDLRIDLLVDSTSNHHYLDDYSTMTQEEEDKILQQNNIQTSNLNYKNFDKPYTIFVGNCKIDLKYFKVKTIKSTLTYHGVRTSRTTRIVDDSIFLDKLRSSCSANLIHSWDAALMSHVVVNLKNVIPLHDSFGVPLSDVPFLMDLVNDWFIYQNKQFGGSLFILL